MVKIRDNRASAAILDLPIHRFELKDAVSLEDALRKLLLAPEVKEFLTRTHTQMPIVVTGSTFSNEDRDGQLSRTPTAPKYSRVMTDVTLGEAFDSLIRVFPGVWIYCQCPGRITITANPPRSTRLEENPTRQVARSSGVMKAACRLILCPVHRVFCDERDGMDLRWVHSNTYSLLHSTGPFITDSDEAASQDVEFQPDAPSGIKPLPQSRKTQKTPLSTENYRESPHNHHTAHCLTHVFSINANPIPGRSHPQFDARTAAQTPHRPLRRITHPGAQSIHSRPSLEAVPEEIRT